MAKAKKSSKKKAAKPERKSHRATKPKQADLPGMEDRRIPDLHAAALAYVEVRDERMAQSKLEKEAKDEVLASMHRHQKNSYVCGDVEITIVPEGEKLKVRVRGADPEPEGEGVEVETDSQEDEESESV